MYLSGMVKARKSKRRTYRPTYIQQWREFRGLTQGQLEQRMEREPGVPLISRVSIGRMEKGKQAYTQPILEAMAVALDCSVWELLEVNPLKEGEVIDLLAEIRRLRSERDPKLLLQATKHLKAIA